MANSATKVHLPRRHVVAVPYPGRGHINPMLNFCKQLISNTQTITKITVIVTEEWLGFINSEHSNRITFSTIPNVLPSEQTRGSDLIGFFKSVQTSMEEPVEKALDTLVGEDSPDLIIADSCLGWVLHLSRRRKLRLASFWTSSVTSFVLSYHFETFELLRDFSPAAGEERIENITGISSIRVSDLPEALINNKTLASFMINTLIIPATKADCIIFRSMDELESQAIKALETGLSNPIFSVGPAIPLKATSTEDSSYMTWLDNQQERSVLYLSLGSFLSTSSSQMDELAAGLRESGVPFIWAARDKTCQLSKALGDQGKVVPWCDQMRVLCHSSVGGFFTHCGWNSTVETVFAGVPALAFPLDADQTLNSKVMVEDWGIGRRVKDNAGEFVGREFVSQVFREFMELECSERKELDRACNELRTRLLAEVSEDGSTSGLHGFLSWFGKDQV